MVQRGCALLRDMNSGLKYVRDERSEEDCLIFVCQKSVTLVLKTCLEVTFEEGLPSCKMGCGRLYKRQRSLIFVNHNLEEALEVTKTYLAILLRML